MIFPAVPGFCTKNPDRPGGQHFWPEKNPDFSFRAGIFFARELSRQKNSGNPDFRERKTHGLYKKNYRCNLRYKRGQDASDKDRTKCPSPANTDLQHFKIAHMGQVRDVCAEQDAEGRADKRDNAGEKAPDPRQEECRREARSARE